VDGGFGGVAASWGGGPVARVGGGNVVEGAEGVD
jgi:hypothetical protein